MRIYSMTATFGKLEHETLTLEPGLNVITAPNEWGKSTWCAFLTAMLYGLDTRAKSTKTVLADKERYAPWSGSPMAGRMDLNWNGRDITIERSTRRRVPLGEFRAYETETGIAVEELTAANCGQMLLGVEQSVFRRAGFIRQSELPVTQDEALRRRLNALVTTGDDSGAGDALADSLRDLKNRCRYNRSGLLPQAEQERESLEDKLAELEELEIQSRKHAQRLEELKDQLSRLHNHRQALAYAQAEQAGEQAAQAKTHFENARSQLELMEAECATLPTPEEAEEKLRELRRFREQWSALEGELERLPPEPREPEQVPPFIGMSPEDARDMVSEDAKTFASLESGTFSAVLLIVGLIGLVTVGILAFLKLYIFALVAAGAALAALAVGFYDKLAQKRQKKDLTEKYGTADVTRWADALRNFEKERRRYEEAMQAHTRDRANAEMRRMQLRQRREDLCRDHEPETMAQYWQEVLSRWDSCAAARREAERAQRHYETIRAMVRTVEKPAMADRMQETEEETDRLIARCAAEQQLLQNRLGQHQGRMANLGDKGTLQKELDQKNRRIAKLEQTYAALTIAQETLAEARTALQRRFAPRITKAAQAMMSEMTGGRYVSLTMGADFSIQAGAEQEDVLHDAVWRSDGTLDQLYLSLRLAVAKELTPDAPVILDDALVRFDDQRMKNAVKVLQNLAREKQVICFTCQGREEKAVNE